MTKRQRYEAAHLLAVRASTNGMTMDEIAKQYGFRHNIVRIARGAWIESLGGGRNHRESLAEAECKIRCGKVV